MPVSAETPARRAQRAETPAAPEAPRSAWQAWVDRYVIDGLTGMAHGLFATLIIGTILIQIASALPGQAGVLLTAIGTVATRMTGIGIGIGVAHRLKAPTLVLVPAGVAGTVGAYAAALLAGTALDGGVLTLVGPGEPFGAFLAAIFAVELGSLVSQKTPVDILVTPAVTIVAGSAVGLLIGPVVSRAMMTIGQVINWGTQQQPFLMGIIVAVLMGILLTLPISSAAIGIILGLSGLAAGAAVVGCSAQMVGFAVASFRENRWGGLVAQGLGTSMLQIANIVKRPVIWLPAIITSAILGPISTVVLGMECNATGSGMGTSGLVGQFMTWQTMIPTHEPGVLLAMIVGLHILAPAVLSLGISEFMRWRGWIRPGDMALAS